MTVGRRKKEDHPARFNSEILCGAIKAKNWNGAYLRRLLQFYGVNPKVDQIMNGHRSPSGPTAALIAHLLDLPLGSLYIIDAEVDIPAATRQLGKPRLRRGRPRLHEQGVSPDTPTGVSPAPEPINVVDKAQEEKNL